MADVNISSSSAPQTSAPASRAVPSYKLRTMANDVEALKRGVVPKAFAILEKTATVLPPARSKSATPPSVFPADKSSPLKNNPSKISTEVKLNALPTPALNNASASIPISAKPKPVFPTTILTPQHQSNQSFNIGVQPKPILPPAHLPVVPTPMPAPAPTPPISFKVSEPFSTKEPFSAPIGKPFQAAPPLSAPSIQPSKPLAMSAPSSLPVRPLTSPPVARPIIPPLPPIKPLMPLRPPITPPAPMTPPPPLASARSFSPPAPPQAPPLPINSPPPSRAMPPRLPPIPSASTLLPAIPPLPPIPTLPPLPKPQETFKPKKSKIIILALLAFIVLVFIIGEIWWFFLREKPQTAPATGTNELLPEPSSENMNNLLPPPPESGAPSTNLAPEESTMTEAIALPDLLKFDRSEIITVDSIDAVAIAKALSNLSSINLKEDELVKITLQSISTPVAMVEFSDLASALKLKLPSAVKEILNSGDVNLFVFGANAFDKDICRSNKNNTPSCFGPRLGLVFKPSQSVGLDLALKSWEKTLVNDLKALILAKIGSPATTVFQSGTYNNQSLRYKNLPLNTITIDYALAGDLFVLTTSKSSMLRAIDALPTTE